jgi:anti-anti-sigma factor
MKSQSECIVQHDDRGVAVVTLLGEHDMASAGEVYESIRSAASDAPVVVNLSNAEFIDSTIIATLLRAHEECEQPVVLEITMSHPARKILDITGLLSVIPTADERNQAIGLSLNGTAR